MSPRPRARHVARSRALFLLVAVVLAGGLLALVAWRMELGPFGASAAPTARATPSPTPSPTTPSPSPSPLPSPSPRPSPEPANAAFAGITTFRGNETRSYYGEGPVPEDPRILWRYPAEGSLCSFSTDRDGQREWCGTGWTGQPNVIVGEGGRIEVRVNAYDGAYHFLDGRNGEPVRPLLQTGDLAKGSATSDPDGFPLYYAGSRDNFLRVIALDRAEPTVLWQLDANTSVPNPVWNDDWDGAPLVVGDYLLEGGENSWFYVIRLHRDYDERGKVTVDPEVVLTVPGFDETLIEELPDANVSIESSVAFLDGVAYFANSGGLVQGWDVSRILRGGTKAERVFRFWTGDDTDASVVIDEGGYLYVASELERSTDRSRQVGQLVKLDPRRPKRPVEWSFHILEEGADGAGGAWATPALNGRMVYVATNYGDLIGLERRTGKERWRIHLAGPTWSSPVVVDDVLLQGDCGGTLHAFDVSKPLVEPPELWSLSLGSCIESTPSVLEGRIWVGTRGGAIYAIGDRRG
jgi:outer membrane protein assembly factor BamB